MIDPTKFDLVPLYDGAQQIVELYRAELAAQQINASGELSRSADFDVDFDENKITVYFIYASYGYYIEHGRNRTTGSTGVKWADPVGDIMQWIQNKKLVPRGNKGIPRTQKEIKRVAYAIVRKINKFGFYGTDHHGKHPLENALKTAESSGILDRMYDAVAKGFDQDITMEIQQL